MMGAFCLLLLGASLPQSTPESLIRRLAHESVEERERAASELRRLGEAALPALRKAVRDSEPEVRARALGVLDRLTWETPVHPGLLARYPEIGSALEARKHAEVLALIRKRERGLHRMGEDFEAFFIALLDSRDREARRTAAARLLRSAWRQERILRRPTAKVFRAIAEWDPQEADDERGGWLGQLARLGYQLSSSVDAPLLARTEPRHPKARVVIRLLRAAAGIRTELPVLGEVIHEGPQEFRWMAFRIIGDLRHAPLRKEVAGLIRERSVRREASEALLSIVDASCRPEVLEFFQATPMSELEEVHFKILLATGAPEAPEILKRIIRRGKAGQKRYAVESLLKLGDPEGMKLLVDPDLPVEVLGAARVAVARVKGEEVRPLVEVLNHPDQKRREKMRMELYKVEDRAAYALMLGVVREDSRELIRNELLTVLPIMKLTRGAPEAYEEFLRDLAKRVGDPISIKAVQQLMSKGILPERIVLAEQVVRHQGLRAAPLFGYLTRHPNPAMIPVAGRILRESTLPTSLSYLTVLGSPEAMAEVERAVRETKSPMVKKYAEGALKNWGKDRNAARKRMRRENEKMRGEQERIDALFRRAGDGDEAAREEVRNLLHEKGPYPYLLLDARWVPSEAIPALLGLMRSWDGDLPERVGKEGVSSCFPQIPYLQGDVIMRWLAATEERSLSEFFIRRIRDPDFAVRKIAMETVGKWRLIEAVPALKAVVRSSRATDRAVAIDVLAEFNLPGTVPFLLEVLRDNPHVAPQALARLGANEAVGPLENLLKDKVPKAAILGALDLLRYPEVYVGIDEPSGSANGLPLKSFGQAAQKALGVEFRYSPEVRRQLLGSKGPSMSGPTFRACLNTLVRGHYWRHSSYTHRVRDGAIEFVRVEDAMQERR